MRIKLSLFFTTYTNVKIFKRQIETSFRNILYTHQISVNNGDNNNKPDTLTLKGYYPFLGRSLCHVKDLMHRIYFIFALQSVFESYRITYRKINSPQPVCLSPTGSNQYLTFLDDAPWQD